MRQSTATYDDGFQTSLRAELAKGVTELGSNPADYDLTLEPAKVETSKPGLKAGELWPRMPGGLPNATRCRLVSVHSFEDHHDRHQQRRAAQAGKSWQLGDADNVDHPRDDHRQPFRLFVTTRASIGMPIVPTMWFRRSGTVPCRAPSPRRPCGGERSLTRSGSSGGPGRASFQMPRVKVATRVHSPTRVRDVH